MSKFKVGDEVKISGFSYTAGYKGQKSVGDTGAITTIRSGHALLDGDEYHCRKWINLNDLELVTSKYPNPPRTWMHERIEFAKGADIKSRLLQTGAWYSASKPAFDDDRYEFRVVPTKTELRIAKIQAKIDSRQIQIDELRVKIDALKSGGGE